MNPGTFSIAIIHFDLKCMQICVELGVRWVRLVLRPGRAWAAFGKVATILGAQFQQKVEVAEALEENFFA